MITFLQTLAEKATVMKYKAKKSKETKKCTTYKGIETFIECRKGDSYTLRPQNPSHLFAFKSFVKNAHSLNVNYIKSYKPRYARA